MATNAQHAKENFLKAILLPIIRWCLKSSIKSQTIFELVKEALVEVADEELQQRGEAPNSNRISVMTGVHRQDVARIRGGESRKKGSDVLTRVIGQWRTDRRFLTDSKRPKVLTLNARSGSFADLVALTSKEINPYTVAFELERLNLVRRKEDEISLAALEFVPKRNLQEIALLLGSDIQDLIVAGEENAIGEKATPNLHLTTRYDNIRVESLPKIQKMVDARRGQAP